MTILSKRKTIELSYIRINIRKEEAPEEDDEARRKKIKFDCWNRGERSQGIQGIRRRGGQRHQSMSQTISSMLLRV